ncbi:MAG TPA: LuxR C-terminal-related transcriptional regulator, partial [Anaerolineales bacterium]|nr:LuxR C-terminal-related transcriptional regulator [Anaerolineales bacterium]
VERGQLHEAFSACQDALKYVESSFKMGGRNPVATAYIYFRLSTILRHWNELEESLWHAKRALEITQKWGSGFRLVYVNLAIALQAVSQDQESMRAIQKAETMAAEESEFWLADIRSVRALLWLDQGNMSAAFRWAQESGLSAEDEIPFSQQRLYLTLAQVLLAQGQNGDRAALDKALHLLSRLQVLFSNSNAQAYLLQVLIFKALVFQAHGKTKEAQEAIRQALSTGEPGDYIRVFVRDAGKMKGLLEQAASKENSLYLQRILSAFGNNPQPEVSKAIISNALVEPLTQREVEVLSKLDTEMSIPEISNELILSVDTVRTHIKRIYRKLDVHSRYEAVTRAKDLKLLLG